MGGPVVRSSIYDMLRARSCVDASERVSDALLMTFFRRSFRSAAFASFVTLSIGCSSERTTDGSREVAPVASAPRAGVSARAMATLRGLHAKVDGSHLAAIASGFAPIE